MGDALKAIGQLRVAAWGILAAACLAGCRNGAVDTMPLPSDAPEWLRAADTAQQKQRQDARQWLEARLQSSYRRAGRPRAVWDEAMLQAIHHVAQARTARHEPEDQALQQALAELEFLNCNDPLFKFWRRRYSAAGRTFAATEGAEYKTLYLALNQSGYDPMEKFWPCWSAFVRGRRTDRTVLRQELERHALAVFCDPEVPEALWAKVGEAYLDAIEEETTGRDARYSPMEQALRRHRGKSASAHALIARIELGRAWLARGERWAEEVEPAAWPVYRERLAHAEQAAEKSWSLRPTPLAATLMISVARSQGASREKMETWFARAMDLDPDNLDACVEKMKYLQPRWYGSLREILDFGHDCLRHPRWRVPLAIEEALNFIAQDLTPENREGFWQNPQVWQLLRTAYERHARLFPQDRAKRLDYFYAAHRAHAWRDAKRQYALIRREAPTRLRSERVDRMLADINAQLVDGE